ARDRAGFARVARARGPARRRAGTSMRRRGPAPARPWRPRARRYAPRSTSPPHSRPSTRLPEGERARASSASTSRQAGGRYGFRQRGYLRRAFAPRPNRGQKHERGQQTGYLAQRREQPERGNRAIGGNQQRTVADDRSQAAQDQRAASCPNQLDRRPL